jgi:hypothetical protein
MPSILWQASTDGCDPFDEREQAMTTTSTGSPVLGTVVAVTPDTPSGTIRVASDAGDLIAYSIPNEALAALCVAVGDRVSVTVKAGALIIGK